MSNTGIGVPLSKKGIRYVLVEKRESMDLGAEPAGKTRGSPKFIARMSLFGE